MKLSDLRPAKGAKSASKRVGRGKGSGLGRTAGRGEKGLRARSGGGTPPGYEGGQMPMQRRIPKRGFHNLFRKEYAVVNVRDLNRFDPTSQNGMPVELFPLETPYRGPMPSYRLWHRLREALVDGWLQWTGSVHMAETPEWLKQQERNQRGGFGVPARSGIMLAPPTRVQVKGAYIGGLLTSLAEQQAWLASPT